MNPRFFFWFLLIVMVLGCGAYISMVSTSYHSTIPLTFNEKHYPFCKIEIESNSYSVMFDSGSVVPLSLRPSALAALHKTPYGIKRYVDYLERQYEAPSYVLPSFKMGDYTFEDVVVIEDKIPCADGYLGWSWLASVKVLLDVSQACLYISNDKQKLLQDGYDIEKMLKVSLEHYKGLVIVGSTDFVSQQRFLIDTGASYNIIQKSIVEGHKGVQESKHLRISGHDFGKTLFDVAPIPIEGIDGILGIEFLKEHVVYIDYRERAIYLEYLK